MKKSALVKSGMALALGLSANVFAQDFCNATHSGDMASPTFSISPGADKGEIKNIGEYNYEIWSKSGDVSATFYSDGSFSCNFTNADDYLCRSGFAYGMKSGKSYKDLGHLYADFSASIADFNGVSYSYIGVYGWSQDPLIEWYIVDSWSPYRPAWIGNNNGTPTCDGCGKIGTITVDGASYDVFVDKVSRGNIEGNGPFTQYFSVRSVGEKRECGTIDITAHFQAWEKLGLKLGSSMYEAKILGEAGQYPEEHGASGSFDFNYAKVYVNGTVEDDGSSEGSSEGGDQTPAGDETAIQTRMAMQLNANKNLQVFDMQGRFLGNVSMARSSSLDAAVRAQFHDAGVYLVKQGSFMQKIQVK